MHFGDALCEMRKGNMVSRQGWNGSGMFAFITRMEVSPATQMVLEAMEKPKTTGIRESMLLYTAQKDLAVWVPSVSDILAFDWFVRQKAFEHPIDEGHQCPSCGIGILRSLDGKGDFTQCPTCLATYPF